MNWLIVGFTLFFFYLIWFGRLIKHRNYSRLLLIVALAHFPYLITNLVAPFRGVLDPNYVGYEFGLLRIPAGIGVALIVGAIVISSFLIATRALKSQMENFWLFTFLFDLFLLISMAGPLILGHPGGPNRFQHSAWRIFDHLRPVGCLDCCYAIHHTNASCYNHFGKTCTS
ncbi:hypothetical protein [Ekhidna sp.]|uniref:hypothetical protein n=1 Tax=Ekhidna sp. TaxID=2608089 RepID=UPI003CCBCA10